MGFLHLPNSLPVRSFAFTSNMVTDRVLCRAKLIYLLPTEIPAWAKYGKIEQLPSSSQPSPYQFFIIRVAAKR
jgi:hypothetical protein